MPQSFAVGAKGGREAVTDPIPTAGSPCFCDSVAPGLSSRAEATGSLAKQPAQSRDPYSVDIKSQWEGVSQEELPQAAASAQRDARSLDSDSRAGAWSPSLGMTVRKVKKRKQLLRCAQDFGRRLRRRQIASTSTPRCDSRASHTAALRMTEGKGWLSAGGRWLSALRRVAQPFQCRRSTSQKSHTGVPRFAGSGRGKLPHICPHRIRAGMRRWLVRANMGHPGLVRLRISRRSLSHSSQKRAGMGHPRRFHFEKGRMTSAGVGDATRPTKPDDSNSRGHEGPASKHRRRSQNPY